MPAFPRGFDLLRFLLALIRILVIELPFFALSQSMTKSDHDLSLGERVYLFMIRRTNVLLPASALRWLTNVGQPGEVLDSVRYKPFRRYLYQEVNKAEFRGFWVLQSDVQKLASLENSDIVILYLHGGGYFASHPDCYLLFMLRLAEGILRSGKKVSIFALNYDLAPESVFPVQLRQATAAYSWLVNEIGIDPKRVLIAGDSAGGHLALSLMCNITHGLDQTVRNGSKSNIQLPKPGLGLMLISPWLSLTDEPDSFRRNAITDVLEGRWLFDIGLQLVGTKTIASIPPHHLQYVEFFKPIEPQLQWSHILPDWTWVSAGSNEVMYDTIAAWVKAREIDCKGRIMSELDRAEPHVYPWLKTLDPGARKRVLGKEYQSGMLTSDPAFADVDRLAQIILARSYEISK